MPVPTPGVIQRLVQPDDGLPRTEWLVCLEPLTWEANPMAAAVFSDEGMKTGYEIACELAAQLVAQGHTHHAMGAVRSTPAHGPGAQGPHGVEDLYRSRRDWRVGKPNCGTD